MTPLTITIFKRTFIWRQMRGLPTQQTLEPRCASGAKSSATPRQSLPAIAAFRPSREPAYKTRPALTLTQYTGQRINVGTESDNAQTNQRSHTGGPAGITDYISKKARCSKYQLSKSHLLQTYVVACILALLCKGSSHPNSFRESSRISLCSCRASECNIRSVSVCSCIS